MRAQFLDAKSVARSRERWIASELDLIQKEHRIYPKLGVLLVTGDQVTMAMVDKVVRLSRKLGFEIGVQQVAERNVDRYFAGRLQDMASDDTFMGIWVATPRFDYPPYDTIYSILQPEKDLAGIHHFIFGKYMFGKPSLIPPKVRAVHDLLEEYVEGYKDRGIVVVSTKNDGTRGFFGKYLAGYFYDLGISVQLRNVFGSSKLKEEVHQIYNQFGEVVITALNTSNAINGDRLKKGSIVIDTGYNFQKTKLTGDVDVYTAGDVCQAITPVPGGVDALIPIEIMANALDIVKTKVGIPRIRTESRGIRKGGR
jgi:methylenetetrahydrofolate dehydrogenase (NADP+)/methenyltetrahydrofolate cyclohydrolase